MKKRVLILLVALAAVLLASCGGNGEETAVTAVTVVTDAQAEDAETDAPDAEPGAEPVEIVIGATAVPHAEILEYISPLLAEKGFSLQIVEFDDFLTPNMALDAGDVDLNYFQHRPFLNTFNENNGTDLVPVAGIHFEPLRVYEGRLDTLENIPDGAAIAIPNDPSNEARALQLLEALGLIQLTPGVGLTATAMDIAENPHGLDIVPMEASQLPRILPDVDFAIINANFALQGGVIHLAIDGAGEEVESEAAINFTNYVVVRAGDEELETVQALVDVITSEAVRDFIHREYQGRVVPMF